MDIIKVPAKGCYFCGKKKDLIKLFNDDSSNSLNAINICKDCKDKLIVILDRDYSAKEIDKRQ